MRKLNHNTSIYFHGNGSWEDWFGITSCKCFHLQCGILDAVKHSIYSGSILLTSSLLFVFSPYSARSYNKLLPLHPMQPTRDNDAEQYWKLDFGFILYWRIRDSFDSLVVWLSFLQAFFYKKNNFSVGVWRKTIKLLQLSSRWNQTFFHFVHIWMNRRACVTLANVKIWYYTISWNFFFYFLFSSSHPLLHSLLIYYEYEHIFADKYLLCRKWWNTEKRAKKTIGELLWDTVLYACVASNSNGLIPAESSAKGILIKWIHFTYYNIN